MMMVVGGMGVRMSGESCTAIHLHAGERAQSVGSKGIYYMFLRAEREAKEEGGRSSEAEDLVDQQTL